MAQRELHRARWIGAEQLNGALEENARTYGVPAINSFAIVDMNSDDYTMTMDEALAPFKVLSNVADDKTLTWPVDTTGTMPTRQAVVVGYGYRGLMFELEGTTAIQAPTGQEIAQISVLTGVGILQENRNVENFKEVSGTTYTIEVTDVGTSFYFSNAAGCTVTIDAACDTPGFWFEAVQGGAAQVVFTSSLTISNVSGHTKTGGQYACVSVKNGVPNAGRMILCGSTGA